MNFSSNYTYIKKFLFDLRFNYHLELKNIRQSSRSKQNAEVRYKQISVNIFFPSDSYPYFEYKI